MAFNDILDSSVINYSEKFEDEDKKRELIKICEETILYEFINYILDERGFNGAISRFFNNLESYIENWIKW